MKEGLLLVKLEAFKDNVLAQVGSVRVRRRRDDDDDDECSENDENDDDDDHHHRSKGGRDTRKARAFNTPLKREKRERERESGGVIKP